MNNLTQLGNKYRLTMEDGKVVTLDDAQKVVDHVNRFDLVRTINGLDILPEYFSSQLSYGRRAPKNYVCNNCKKEFDEPHSVGENESEADVCPHCKSDNFTSNK